MIARRNDLDAEIEQFFSQSTGNAETGRGVFPIRDGQVDGMLSHQLLQVFLNNVAAWAAENIPNKKNAQRVFLVVTG